MSADITCMRRTFVLLALVSGLPLAVAAAGSASAASCGSVGVGSAGERVAAVQTAVGAASDGDFGSGTLAAVQSAEKSRGLAVTSAVDQPTYVRLGGTGDFCSMDTWSSPVVASPADSPQTRVDAEIAFAKAQVGKAYLWGGTGPARFDCSGLVMQGLHAIGVNLGRVATSQYQAGATHVPVAQARPGDLLVYGTNASPSAIYHIAVFVGGGQMVEAQNPRTGVVMDAVRTYDLLPDAVRPVDGTIWQPAGLTAPAGTAPAPAPAPAPTPAPAPAPAPLSAADPAAVAGRVQGNNPSAGRSRSAARGAGATSAGQSAGAPVTSPGQSANGLHPEPAPAVAPRAVAAAATPAATAPHVVGRVGVVVLTRYLRQNMTGTDVAAVQKILGVPADGVFGPQTLAALQTWQGSHSLAADGVVGPATAAAMGFRFVV